MNPITLTKKSLLLALAVSGAVFSLTETSRAQSLVYFQNFDVDDSANWTSNSIGNADNPANFYFDYSTVGIPSAPNSTNGTTRGLKLQAQLDPASGQFPSGVSVSPIGFGISDNFEMHWDMWINYCGSGNGSAQVGGGGFGTAGNVANVAGTADAVVIGANGNLGTPATYRVYSPGKAASYQGGQYVLNGGFYGPAFTDFQAGDSGSGFVYGGTDGSRNGANIYYATNFPGGTNPPAAQITAYPSQTGLSTPDGSVAFTWRDVSITKIGNVIRYKIDGILIATVDAVDAAIDPYLFTTYGTNSPLGGTNILFNQYSTGSGVPTNPDATNLLFSLFDNVRITNFPSVVTVSATIPKASEQGPVSGRFTITRTSAGAEFTVNYTMTGTANSNGTDYVTLPGSVTFAATATSTNIDVTPVDDAVVEPTETVILNIEESTNYVGAGSATITIADNESPQLTITNVSTQMYERTNDYATFRIARLGNTNATAFTVNFTFTGAATSGTDFYADAVTMSPGEETKNFKIYPLEDSFLEGNETVIATLAAGAGYTIGSSSSATNTIVDSALPPEEILFSDNFDTDTSSNWTQRFGSTNGFEDFTFTFNYDYSLDSIPSAPHSTNGTTRGLKMTVNKLDSTPLGAAGINFYPNGQNFSGDYALRFDMYLIDAGGNNATEGALFGINHSGTKTNWFRLSGGGVPAGWNFDGLFFNVQADNQNASTSYALWSTPTTTNNNPTKLTFASHTNFTGIFKAPPWAVTGLPSNLIPSTNSIWADVEARQINNVVTLKVNNTEILSYTNTGGTTSGNIMMGYVDPFDSIGLASSAVIYDNVRVIRSHPYRITSVVKSGGSILIDFTYLDTAEAASAFKLQSSATVDGPYADISATITQTAAGFHVVASAPSDVTYYRIRHL